mgnify:CR=1 FL=1
MLGFLWRLLVGSFQSCPHKWVMLEEGYIHDAPTKNKIGAAYVMRCERCGCIKRKKVSLV